LPKSSPHSYHPSLILSDLNKPEYNLQNSDIEKSKPNFIKFSTTRPPNNPLNPVYKLPEVEIMPPTPPKFIRDQLSNEVGLISYYRMWMERNRKSTSTSKLAISWMFMTLLERKPRRNTCAEPLTTLSTTTTSPKLNSSVSALSTHCNHLMSVGTKTGNSHKSGRLKAVLLRNYQ